mmetsp:Transcript_2128/g.6352  ORF Transcript_2128/g.6352 Transcript_2128/m.6352 type:complete len:130 (-) Transcript_2128:106-495(-)
MAGEESDRAAPAGGGRGRGSAGGRSRGGGKNSGGVGGSGGGGGSGGAVWEEKSSAKKFDVQEASNILSKGWQTTLDELKDSPEGGDRPFVYKRQEMAWNSARGNIGRNDFIAMLDSALKKSQGSKKEGS